MIQLKEKLLMINTNKQRNKKWTLKSNNIQTLVKLEMSNNRKIT